MSSNLALRVGTGICMLAFLASLVPIGVSSGEERAPEARVSDRAVGAGRWQSQRDDLGNRDWQVQITRFDDDSIEGSLVGGVSGTYSTSDGDKGNWTWAGPAGARSLREKPESADPRP